MEEKNKCLQGRVRTPCGDGTVLHLDTINASILFGILDYSLAGSYCLEEVGKEYVIPKLEKPGKTKAY